MLHHWPTYWNILLKALGCWTHVSDPASHPTTQRTAGRCPSSRHHKSQPEGPDGSELFWQLEGDLHNIWQILWLTDLHHIIRYRSGNVTLPGLIQSNRYSVISPIPSACKLKICACIFKMWFIVSQPQPTAL